MLNSISFEKIKIYFDKRCLKVLMLLTVILSALSLMWVYFNNYMVIYTDAPSHLNIARRVIDNLIPGFAQLGGVWLPVQHLLMLPFIWNDFLWYSGLAGAIISALAFVGSSYFMFRLVEILTKNRIAAFFSSLIIITNPNMLYLQATPMGETLFVFLVIASVYYLAKWAKTENITALIASSVLIFMSALTRYEGWILILAEILVIAIIAYKRKNWKKAEGNILIFGSFACLSLLLWISWNYFILGDPLYFMHSEFSASGQQEGIRESGLLPTYNNLFLSIKYYLLDIAEVNGYILFFLSAFGLFVAAIKEKLKTINLFFLIFISIILFEIFALYQGTTIISLPQLPPFGVFNTRYGIFAIPLIAMLIGYLFTKNYKMKMLVIIMFISQIFLFTSQVPITLADPFYEIERSDNIKLTAANFIKQNYENGNVLIAAGEFDKIIYFSQVPMKNIIHEGTQHYWLESLENPIKHAEWIVMANHREAPLDNVTRKLFESEIVKENYNQVFAEGKVLIFKKKSFKDSEKSTVSKTLPTEEISTPAISDGDLIRNFNAQNIARFDIYEVKIIGDKKFKRLILNPYVFESYSYLKWENVKSVNQSTFNSFATSDLAYFANDDRIYKLYPKEDTGQKRLIKNTVVLARLGYDADSIYEINQIDKNSYATEKDLE